MKIAIVCYPTFGGSGVVATELGLELAHRGHEIHFITYKQPVRLALLNSNVHYHEVNVPEYKNDFRFTFAKAYADIDMLMLFIGHENASFMFPIYNSFPSKSLTAILPSS